MPLPKRQVEPVHVSRGTVPERLTIPCELEAVTNGTLANTVRQLSSLSKHAEDIFGELTRHATDIADRTNVLQARIDRLAVKVTQLDSNVEEVSLQDIQMRKPFRSGRAYDQQIFSRASMPSAMLDTYARCDPPPPLERLNEFRDDGKDARKFYTDPDYFFELWRREMLQDTERIQLDRGKKVRSGRGRNDADGGRTTRRVRPPQSTRERQKQEAIQRGEAIMPIADYKGPPSETLDGVYGTVTRPASVDIGNYHSPRITSNGHIPSEATSPEAWGGMARRPRPSQPPPAPPEISAPTGLDTPTRSNLPPPPPPPAADASPLDLHLHRMHTAIGPAPPPPPTPPAAPPPPPASVLNNVAPNSPHVTPQSPHPTHNQPQAPDPRNELLKAIRDGIKLRTVAKSEVGGRYDTLRGTPGPNDVASILQRRLAVEFSDSDESNDENEDDEAWNESRA